MAMPTAEISDLLTAAFPGGTINVGGAEGKYQVTIVSAFFAGMNRVKRQQSVYNSQLNSFIGKKIYIMPCFHNCFNFQF